jgi:hypothetical protein
MEPDNISYIDEHTDLDNKDDFDTDGILGCDGNIYAIDICYQVQKVDTLARTVSVTYEMANDIGHVNPLVGPDQCIYWLQKNFVSRIMKFDPVTQEQWYFPIEGYNGVEGWSGGALADDGVIYYAPFRAFRVLAIDPFRDLSVTIKDNIRLYPQELGRLFVQTGESYRESLFDSAVRKFGHDKAVGLLDECLPSDDELGDEMASDGIPLFILAASRDVGDDGVGGAPLDVIYHLMRRNVQGLLSD